MLDDVSIWSHPRNPPIHKTDIDYENTIFVIFDTVMFSSSVVTLLDDYVDLVRPIVSVSELEEYGDDDEWIVGGEGNYSNADFSNSIHHIKSVLGYNPPKQSKAVLNSNNGAVASHRLARETPTRPQEIIIGAPANLEAVTQYIQDVYQEASKPYSLIMYGAGHRGHPEFEDIFASWILYMNLEMEESRLSYEAAEDILKMYIQHVKWSDASWFHKENISLLSNWNTSKTIPVFDYDQDGFIKHSTESLT